MNLLILNLLMLMGLCKAEKRVLVLLENLAIKETHSIFFKNMLEDHFDLTFKVADDASLNIKKYGQFLYDHIVVFAPTVEEFGGTLNVEAMTDFIDSGGNLFVAGNSNLGEVLRDIAGEVGFEVDEEGTHVIDHLNYDLKDGGQHTLVIADPENLINSEKITGSIKFPLLYRGVGLVVDEENPLVLPILTGSSTTYSHNPDLRVKEYPYATGKQTVLIAGLQARNNARVIFAGSLEFFSDEFFKSSVEPKDGTKVDAANEALSRALYKWCFKQSGVLKVESIAHHRKNEDTTPNFYTIKDDVVYTIVVRELIDGQWLPFEGKDMQMEFVRIDPFVRVTMENVGNGQLVANFKVPDTYGVYQFKVNYHRVGLTRLYSTNQISVIPLRHDQYERFIVSAYPYYASAFSMMTGVCIFAMVFLHFKDEESKKKAE